jgi:hypothetical protein
MFESAAFSASLHERGYAHAGRVLSDEECRELIALYENDALFRKHVIMERHNFGIGDYKYFANPLPQVVGDVREQAYSPLASIANQWMESLRVAARYPGQLDEFLARCGAAGQKRPTPLILHYTAGGYNCLHQDLYGELAFPLQLVVMLSEPGVDYEGGELVLVEQRPRMQSKPVVLRPRRGEGVVFANNERPAAGRNGFYRVKMRHGVSEVTKGERYALGVIFHDAE